MNREDDIYDQHNVGDENSEKANHFLMYQDNNSDDFHNFGLFDN
jgi:hypothetical protein